VGDRLVAALGVPPYGSDGKHAILNRDLVALEATTEAPFESSLALD